MRPDIGRTYIPQEADYACKSSKNVIKLLKEWKERGISVALFRYLCTIIGLHTLVPISIIQIDLRNVDLYCLMGIYIFEAVETC